MGKISELMNKTEEIISLLEKSDCEFWAKRFATALKQLENSDSHGCYLINSFYGGMGSFNDSVPSEGNKLSLEIFELSSDLWDQHGG